MHTSACCQVLRLLRALASSQSKIAFWMLGCPASQERCAEVYCLTCRCSRRGWRGAQSGYCASNCHCHSRRARARPGEPAWNLSLKWFSFLPGILRVLTCKSLKSLNSQMTLTLEKGLSQLCPSVANSDIRDGGFITRRAMTWLRGHLQIARMCALACLPSATSAAPHPTNLAVMGMHLTRRAAAGALTRYFALALLQSLSCIPHQRHALHPAVARHRTAHCCMYRPDSGPKHAAM